MEQKAAGCYKRIVFESWKKTLPQSGKKPIRQCVWLFLNDANDVILKRPCATKRFSQVKTNWFLLSRTVLSASNCFKADYISKNVLQLYLKAGRPRETKDKAHWRSMLLDEDVLLHHICAWPHTRHGVDLDWCNQSIILKCLFSVWNSKRQKAQSKTSVMPLRHIFNCFWENLQNCRRVMFGNFIKNKRVQCISESPRSMDLETRSLMLRPGQKKHTQERKGD